MALAPGTRIGVYDVSAQIGVGGMGEVYRARDTKLGRDVAIKVLPDAVASDAERIARFEREAKTLAALNHPNIAAIHGFEESTSLKALVMEFVDGPTLADRIEQGPIPVDEALPIAKQIAEALEAAHEQGIIHRDLKPANIKVRSDGTVKVLDFGLAKAMEPVASAAQSISVSMSPTITTPAMTQAGMILGTAAYMSPEQARGKAVDKRTDIWAFGCVLFEMVTGRRAFEGEDVTDTLASVVKMSPDFSLVPPKLRALVERCLEKDPRKRVRDIGDWMLLVGEGAASQAPSGPASQPSPTRWMWPAAVAVLAVAAAVAVWAPWRADPVLAPTRLQTFPAGLDPASMTGFAVSPDGRSVVIESGQQLWLWSLDSLDARMLPGAEGAAAPFWSRDSRSVGFVAGSALRRIDIAGGPPQTVLGMGAASGTKGTWNGNEVMLFRTPDGGFARVPSRGGEATPVAKPSREGGHLDLPVFLPDGIHFLYLDHTTADLQMRGIYVGSIDLGPDEQASTPILSADDGPLLVSDAQWDNPQVVFERQGELLAQPFDTGALAPVGDAIPIATGVAGGAGNGWMSASATGDVLLYRSGASGNSRTLVWVDRRGVEEPIDLPPRQYVYAQLSPDGTRVALDSRDEELDIWVWNFAREALQRLTFAPGRDSAPVWSRDGQRIAFLRENGAAVGPDGGADQTVVWQAADGSGVPDTLVGESSGANFQLLPSGFSPDGKSLVYGLGDVWMVPIGAKTDAAMPLLSTPADERNAVVSPDGRWLAYQSDESGGVEIHIRPFPDTQSGHWQVSTGGGTRPLWSRDGKELFYYTPGPPGALMLARIEAGATTSFAFGRPEQLFQTTYPGTQGGNQTYDVSRDGTRFLMIKPVETNERPGLVVVQHWFESSRLAPTN